MSETSEIKWGASIPNSPAFPEYVVGKGGKPKKKKAKTTKMVIADPGLAIEVEFGNQDGGEDETVAALKLQFDLFIVDHDASPPTESDSPTHYVEFGIHNGSEFLQVPASYKFVVPFADKDWITETGKGSNGEPLKDFYFRLNFQVEEPDGEWEKGSIEPFPREYIKAGEKFDFSPQSPFSYTPTPQCSDGSDPGNHIEYDEVRLNPLAICWQGKYQKDASYTSIRDDATHKETYFLPFDEDGNDRSSITEPVVSILPKPFYDTDSDVITNFTRLRTNLGACDWDLVFADHPTIPSGDGSITIELVSS